LQARRPASATKLDSAYAVGTAPAVVSAILIPINGSHSYALDNSLLFLEILRRIEHRISPPARVTAEARTGEQAPPLFATARQTAELMTKLMGKGEAWRGVS
jgi:hypothetical protein